MIVVAAAVRRIRQIERVAHRRAGGRQRALPMVRVAAAIAVAGVSRSDRHLRAAPAGTDRRVDAALVRIGAVVRPDVGSQAHVAGPRLPCCCRGLADELHGGGQIAIGAERPAVVEHPHGEQVGFRRDPREGSGRHAVPGLQPVTGGGAGHVRAVAVPVSGEQTPSGRQGRVDIASRVIGAEREPRGRRMDGVGQRLVPDAEDPGGAVGVPEIMVGPLDARVHHRHDHAGPLRERRVGLVRTDLGGRSADLVQHAVGVGGLQPGDLRQTCQRLEGGGRHAQRRDLADTALDLHADADKLALERRPGALRRQRPRVESRFDMQDRRGGPVDLHEARQRPRHLRRSRR